MLWTVTLTHGSCPHGMESRPLGSHAVTVTKASAGEENPTKADWKEKHTSNAPFTHLDHPGSH